MRARDIADRHEMAPRDFSTRGRIDWRILSGRKAPHPEANRMECAAWPHVRGDLSSTRREAAVFLDNLEEISEAIGRRNCVGRWTYIGDTHRVRADLNIKRGGLAEGAEAWLCALTAFEVARRLTDEHDAQNGELLAEVQAGIQELGLSLEQKLERVQIVCCDETELLAYYLPASDGDLSAPAAICISREDETAVTLLGRLLPAVIGRGVSLLVASHADISNQWRGQSEMLLSSCLDYLSTRPEVDVTRIGVYGEGLSAVLATDFAVSDRRVAAAVCDGGLWNWVRVLASVDWMTSAADVWDEYVMSTRRSRLARQLRCPVLVVAGGRGIVSVSEAIKLRADCSVARIDLELTMPRTTRTSLGEVENFVSSDDYIFGWLTHKLADAAAR